MKSRLVLSCLMILCLTDIAWAARPSLREVAKLAGRNKPAQALSVLARYERTKAGKADPDLMKMTKARLLFQMKRLDEAYNVYSSVSKSSPYWLQSVEERAHTMGRKGDYAKAIADLQTLMTPTFASAVGPEPYFVAAMTHLRICNYSQVYDDTKKFKKHFAPRIAALQLIKTAGNSPAVDELMERLKTQNLSFETVGSLVKDLPRDLSTDAYALSLNVQKAGDRARLKQRIVTLAKSELKEIDNIITKLQLVEAEVVHRVALSDGSRKDRATQGHIQSNADTLTFPVTDEVWVDELDSFAAQVEKCPTAEKRVSL